MPTPFLLLQDFGMAHRSAAGDATLLAGVDLEVPAGRFYLLLGHSGGGKSSLLRLCTGLLDPREVGPQLRGRIECLGESLAGPFPPALRGRVLAILQDEGLLDELSPRQNVELALVAAGRSRKLAPALLAQVGLDPAPQQTAALSGGMRKRLAVARALATQPAVLWCDEPTAGLDPAAARQVAMLLRDAHAAAADRTTIVITHDREAFEGLVDAILLLDRNTQQLRVLAKDEPVSTGMPSPASAALPPSSLHALRGRLLGLSAVGETLITSLVRLPPAHPGMMVREVARQCLEPLLFVGTVGAVIGGLATFFALRNNPIEGAFEAQVLTGTGKVLTAVLIPLLAGLFFCARIAAGASARIGTMQRTQQVSALTMMGVNPADFLLTPLVWAMVIALPVSTAVACIAAAAASWLAATSVSNIATESWAAWFYATVDLRDVRGVLGGAALTGYLVAIATWHLSIAEKRSGRDVGNAVNASIVTGMTLVLAVHAVLTFGRYA